METLKCNPSSLAYICDLAIEQTNLAKGMPDRTRNLFTSFNSILPQLLIFSFNSQYGGITNISTPLFLMARDTSPNLGLTVRNTRKLECGRRTTGLPSTTPHSLSVMDPDGSTKELILSST
jgi:hypothetical protein